MKEARLNYKSCHYCFTFYCSRECRQEHWIKHKEKCIFAKAVSVAKQALRYVYNNPNIMEALAKIGIENNLFEVVGHFRILIFIVGLS